MCKAELEIFHNFLTALKVKKEKLGIKWERNSLLLIMKPVVDDWMGKERKKFVYISCVEINKRQWGTQREERRKIAHTFWSNEKEIRKKVELWEENVGQINFFLFQLFSLSSFAPLLDRCYCCLPLLTHNTKYLCSNAFSQKKFQFLIRNHLAAIEKYKQQHVDGKYSFGCKNKKQKRKNSFHVHYWLARKSLPPLATSGQKLLWIMWDLSGQKWKNVKRLISSAIRNTCWRFHMVDWIHFCGL